MTNEGIKDELYRMLSDVNGGYPKKSDAQKDRYREAVGVAIRSLEAWKNVQKEIYRQIDALDEIHEFRDRNAYFKALDIVNKYLKEVENDKIRTDEKND